VHRRIVDRLVHKKGEARRSGGGGGKLIGRTQISQVVIRDFKQQGKVKDGRTKFVFHMRGLFSERSGENRGRGIKKCQRAKSLTRKKENRGCET